MTENPPYREAMRHEAGVSEIKQNSGKQFDPAIVELFFKVVNGNTNMAY
jgi:HD-GYP domain-containing protein (c-di-GMP phosphodiesterase class II)